jgi:MinD-like ATPase involved in chromosome partitioning or flagellar assembly
VTVNGNSHPVKGDTLDETRVAVLAHVTELAAGPLGRPVRVDTVDPDGHWQLVVHPDGQVDDFADDDHSRRRRAPHVSTATGELVGRPPARPAGDHATQEIAQPPAVVARPSVRAVPAQVAGPAVATPRPPAPAEPTAAAPTLHDLLAARPPASSGPAQRGWQAAVRRMTGGLVSPSPGPAELAHRAAVTSVQRSLDGPKTIVVVNPKGGAHKTTATLLLAATFGIHRGGYTLAWDNNETRGTLGWRANPARHSNTAVDLLRDLDRFTDSRAARVGDLDNYVRAQGSAQFDVLASDEDAASAASIDDEAFRQLHTALARFYRVMVIDTGNNMRASNWQAAVAAADQLVIVSTVREDTAQSAAWLIDALRATGNAHVVREAVTVLTAPARTPDAELSQRLHSHFGQLTRTVLDVPHDPALVAGGPIAYDTLTPRSQDAWLRVTAAVADGL